MRKRSGTDTTLRIAALVANDTAYGGPILSGVLRYARLGRRWIVRHLPPTDHAFRLLDEWKPAGVVAFAWTSQIIDALRSTRVPFVNVSHSVDDDRHPCVHADDHAVGEAAAEHLLSRGFRQFAVVGSFAAAHARDRRDGFLKRVGEARMFEPERVRDQHRSLDDFEQAYMHWLIALPKPIGVFTIADNVGERLLDLCLQARLAVPEEMAVVSANDDAITCEGCWPPLSSVRLPFQQIGYEAARMLEQLIRGNDAGGPHVMLPPLGVRVRQSSDSLATDRAEIRQAVQFMRDHLEEPITVSDILRDVPVSRRALELSFRAVLSRTPAEHLQHLRMQRARELLLTTDAPLPEIARACGYADTSRFAAAFKFHTGTPPATFRRNSRIENRRS